MKKFPKLRVVLALLTIALVSMPAKPQAQLAPIAMQAVLRAVLPTVAMRAGLVANEAAISATVLEVSAIASAAAIASGGNSSLSVSAMGPSWLAVAAAYGVIEYINTWFAGDASVQIRGNGPNDYLVQVQPAAKPWEPGVTQQTEFNPPGTTTDEYGGWHYPKPTVYATVDLSKQLGGCVDVAAGCGTYSNFPASQTYYAPVHGYTDPSVSAAGGRLVVGCTVVDDCVQTVAKFWLYSTGEAFHIKDVTTSFGPTWQDAIGSNGFPGPFLTNMSAAFKRLPTGYLPTPGSPASAAEMAWQSVDMSAYPMQIAVHRVNAVQTPVVGNMSEIKAQFPEMMGTAVPTELVLATLNTAWSKAASSPGYTGLAYSTMTPITRADVISATAGAAVTFGELVGPNVATLSQSGACLAPAVLRAGYCVTDTGPATPGAAISLGPNPEIGAPGLESEPTGAEILAPILNLLPSFKHFTVPSHNSVCPVLDLQVFGASLQMSSHCEVLETQRQAFAAMFSVVWVLASLFIVLRA